MKARETASTRLSMVQHGALEAAAGEGGGIGDDAVTRHAAEKRSGTENSIST
ncbi:MAG: hypothetical protein R3D02_00430 [Hyphomicrobiales bacterium]